jgi:hypothetical protein
MAFAGNDLVNFIGVPLAGYASYKTGLTPEMYHPNHFQWKCLPGEVGTPPLCYLFQG